MIYIILTLLAIILVWRVILPSMRLEPRANGVDTSAKSSATDVGWGRFAKYSKIVPSILLILAGAALVFWELKNPQIRPMDVGNVSWKYWHVVLTLWGIVAALIALNACGTMAKTLQKVLAGVVAALLIVFPLWGWVASPSAPVAHATSRSAEIPLASAAHPMSLTMPAGGRTGLIESRPHKRVVIGGEKFRLHNVYRNGHECAFGEPCVDGPLAGVYATNEDKENQNTVSVSYK